MENKTKTKQYTPSKTCKQKETTGPPPGPQKTTKTKNKTNQKSKCANKEKQQQQTTQTPPTKTETPKNKQTRQNQTPQDKKQGEERTSHPGPTETTTQIYFTDPDEEHWQKDLQDQQNNMTDQQRSREPHSRPEDANLLIYPTMINSRIEHLYIEIKDPEPTTTAQRRREELALGRF